MGKFRGVDTSVGWQNRKIRDLQKALEQQRAAKRLPASSFENVPAGAIPTSALSDPNAPGSVYLTATGFGLSATGADVINSSVSVLAGFTSCVVSVTGRVFAYNSTGAGDSLRARPIVNGATGIAVPILTAPAAAGLNVSPFTVVLTSLTPGSSFTVALWAASTTAAWGTNAANTADLSGVLLWF